jgi:hypothetical protein
MEIKKTDFEAMAQDVSKVGKEASVWNRFHSRNSLQGKTTVSNLVTSHSLRPSQRAECPAGWPQKGGKKAWTSETLKDGGKIFKFIWRFPKSWG